jgi:heme O synthase-like polyprenyltransferase
VDAAAFLEPCGVKGQDYAKASIPVLPVVVPAYAGRWRSSSTRWRLPWSAGAALVRRRAALRARRWYRRQLFRLEECEAYRDPSKENAMANFFASLVQLALLIAGALLASAVRHWL